MEVLIFIVGAAGYAGVEYLYRGYTHWTMVLPGGACLLAFYCYTKETKDTPLLVQAAAGACIVTVFEFCVGVVVNLWYGWHVWDYSREPCNLLGQSCSLFSCIWFLLCLISLMLFSALDSWYNKMRKTSISDR